MINDPAKIPALIGFAAQAQAAGARIWQATFSGAQRNTAGGAMPAVAPVPAFSLPQAAWSCRERTRG